MWIPCLLRSTRTSGEVVVRVGHDLVDEYLRFLSGRDPTPSWPRATT